MMKKWVNSFLCFLIVCVVVCHTASAATLSPALITQLNGLNDNAGIGLVIVAFHNNNGLNPGHLNVLRGVGIDKGLMLQNLGMVAVTATAGQVRALSGDSAVRSIWSNDRLEYFMDSARALTGVDRVRTDAGFTLANGGLPVSGKGDFSVLVIDSGIDATHDDLKFGEKVIQNVQIIASTQTVEGFTPLVTLENIHNTDQSVGHGTHCAGIIGGTGQWSGGRYAGVAPGAKLIGAGLGAGIVVINALAGWEWAIANQFHYNIRVVSNSYGSFAPFNPDDPINIASKSMHDRNVVVVFAGANSGPGKGTWNRYAKAPWVIGVAMGHKEGGLASGSSRGTPREERLGNADPLDDYDVPTITAPGSGREFASSAGRFTTDIVSVRATSNVSANGTTDDAEIPLGFVPFYTQISGTSMATPFVAGTVALMLDADPTLTPDEVKSIIQSTATPMPGREEWEVGAGFLNSYSCVDKAFNRSRQYGSYLNPTFNAQLAVSGPSPQPFSIPFNPSATPGAGSPNSRTFTVDPNTDVLDVFANIATTAGLSNSVAIVLTAPDGTLYSSGVATPYLTAPSRQVIVKSPLSGTWLLEVRGARGLAAVPQVSSPTSGAAVPSTVSGTIRMKEFVITPAISDLQSHPARFEIERAIKNRRMDIFADGTFRPDVNVTRGDFARVLSLNTALRQSLGAVPRFTDVSGDLGAIAEAVIANGSTLRDWNFSPAGLMAANGSSFNPEGTVTRLDLAVAFVRALGLDAQARAGANSTVMSGGQALCDNTEIPAALRGYVQIALDKGLLEAFPAEVRQIAPGQFIAIPGPRVEPDTVLTRASLAMRVNKFAQLFKAGN